MRIKIIHDYVAIYSRPNTSDRDRVGRIGGGEKVTVLSDDDPFYRIEIFILKDKCMILEDD